MNISSRVSDLHARFCGALTHRYFIRVHMTVMLTLVLASGALAGRLLLRTGVSNMGFRYPAVVLLSYGVFFVLIRIWLAYVCRADRVARKKATAGSDSSDGSGVSGGFFGGGGRSGGGSSAGFASGGGSSGGAGSSGGWDEGASPQGAVIAMPSDGSAAPGSGSGSSRGFHGFSSGSGSGGSGGGDDGDGLLLLVLFCVLAAAVFGAGVYVVYQAPAILSDAAFQAALAGGLVPAAKGIHDRGWFGSVFRATAIPFAIVLILSGIFGYEAHRRCPGAATAGQVLRRCVFS